MATTEDPRKELPAEELHDRGRTEEEDELFARRERSGGRPPLGVSDFVRRAIETTVGQVQNQSGLPKEAINYLLQQGERGRREVVRIVAKEVGDFLRATDISSEVVKVLTNVQVDFSAKLRFKRNSEGGLTQEVVEDAEQARTEDLPVTGPRESADAKHE